MVYTFLVTIIDDESFEGDEYFTLSIVDPPGFENVTLVITIKDNDRKSLYPILNMCAININTD